MSWPFWASEPPPLPCPGTRNLRSRKVTGLLPATAHFVIGSGQNPGLGTLSRGKGHLHYGLDWFHSTLHPRVHKSQVHSISRKCILKKTGMTKHHQPRVPPRESSFHGHHAKRWSLPSTQELIPAGSAQPHRLDGHRVRLTILLSGRQALCLQ